MLLLLREAISRSGGTDLQFFASCYWWKYGKSIDVFGDILAYRTQQVVPTYVKEFLAYVYD